MSIQTTIPFGQALAFWLKLGFISFGGPAGQIAIMHREVVEKRRWVSEKRFLHALNYCMLLPGPEAQQLATYLGWLMHGTRGGVVAGSLFVLPSFFILAALAWAILTYGDKPALQAILYGVKPAVVALVFVAAWRLANRTLHHPALVAMTLVAGLVVGLTDFAFPWVIAVAAITGALLARTKPSWLHRDAGEPTSKTSSQESAMIDDDTPTPAHARFRPVAAGALVVGTASAGVALWWWLGGVGSGGTLREMASFFTQAAMVTFGGAYAVLPYVFEAAVQKYGWLTTGQMMDGLALGESTPGPLIMVVTYIGFVGAVTREVFGSHSILAAGLAGATVATLFTYVPSFLFILVGGPLVESTRDSRRLAGPLTCISACVIGVMGYLGIVFGAHVLLPAVASATTLQIAPSVPHFDWLAAVITLSAAVALKRYNVNTIAVIGVCAFAGWVIR